LPRICEGKENFQNFARSRIAACEVWNTIEPFRVILGGLYPRRENRFLQFRPTRDHLPSAAVDSAKQREDLPDKYRSKRNEERPPAHVPIQGPFGHEGLHLHFPHREPRRRIIADAELMNIQRSGTTRLWSDTAAFGGLVFLCEVAEDPIGDIGTQTAEVLARLAQRLAEAGSGVDRILMATIHLPEPADRAKFNELWAEWIPEGCAPVRACIHAALADPRLRVEIQLIAAAR
jgi:enamine deaminase RidA (YjgF/YER057c/UK114 family)